MSEQRPTRFSRSAALMLAVKSAALGAHAGQAALVEVRLDFEPPLLSLYRRSGRGDQAQPTGGLRQQIEAEELRWLLQDALAHWRLDGKDLPQERRCEPNPLRRAEAQQALLAAAFAALEQLAPGRALRLSIPDAGAGASLTLEVQD